MPAKAKPPLWEKIVAFCFAAAMVSLLIYLVWRNQPFADANIVVFVRAFFAVSVAVICGTISGFLNIEAAFWKITLRAGGAIAFGVLTYIYTPTVLPPLSPPPPAQEPPKNTSLDLRLDEDARAKAKMEEGLIKRSGPVFEFALINPLSGTALVEAMYVEVLDVVEDRLATTETMIDRYEFAVSLAPETRGRVQFAKDFKYAPGDADKIAVAVHSTTKGYDYLFRFVIKWYDSVSKETRETTSDILVVAHPSLAGGLSRSEVGALREKHNESVDRRVAELRKKFPKK